MVAWDEGPPKPITDQPTDVLLEMRSASLSEWESEGGADQSLQEVRNQIDIVLSGRERGLL